MQQLANGIDSIWIWIHSRLPGNYCLIRHDRLSSWDFSKKQDDIYRIFPIEMKVAMNCHSAKLLAKYLLKSKMGGRESPYLHCLFCACTLFSPKAMAGRYYSSRPGSHAMYRPVHVIMYHLIQPTNLLHRSPFQKIDTKILPWPGVSLFLKLRWVV